VHSYAFAQYDAFTDIPFGGSQAAIITDAGEINFETRQQIAREIGLPATAFVNAVGRDWVEVQFLSTVMELPMCGHGTICLMTHLAETGTIRFDASRSSNVRLRLPGGTADVELGQADNGRVSVMLEIQPPEFAAAPGNRDLLAGVLGISVVDFHEHLPLEVARGDFVHLVVPLPDLETIRRITPDFQGIDDFSHDHGIETIVVFCSQTESSQCDLHVRDFCPAVGVPESAAAGTTNAALTGYLVRHGLIEPGTDGNFRVTAEQGHEINRPSIIRSIVEMRGNSIARLQVGGVATKIMDGQIYL
jgi:PhzF family phenazine biosynthesis protein